MTTSSTTPNWVLSSRQKGQEIKKIQNKYYLYEVSSYYCKERKRTIKKSGKCLGRITEQGIINTSNKSDFSVARQVSSKEDGASNFIVSLLATEQVALEKHLPTCWQEVLVCVVFRLLYQSAFKQMCWHYESSYLSELFPNLRLRGKQISTWLHTLGENRGNLAELMRSFQQGEEIILVDSTHITTHSRQNLSAQLGYNSQRQFDPQINLLYLFSQDKQLPVFYRCVQGSIREVRSLKLTLEESGLKKSILVSDKGFYSDANIQLLEDEKWHYVLPIRRSMKMASYEPLKGNGKENFDGFFRFEKRIIWHKTTGIENQKRSILFFDESLKVVESEDYLRRVTEEKEGYSLELFHKKQHTFGTITVLTNTIQEKKAVKSSKKNKKDNTKNEENENSVPLLHNLEPEKVFGYLKSRNDIEQLNDTYKNVLQADKTYMQSEMGMEAWHFINFLALRVYYKIFALLKEKQLNDKYSPADILLLLQNKKKIKINEEWVDAEVPKKAKVILDKLFENKT